MRNLPFSFSLRLCDQDRPLGDSCEGYRGGIATPLVEGSALSWSSRSRLVSSGVLGPGILAEGLVDRTRFDPCALAACSLFCLLRDHEPRAAVDVLEGVAEIPVHSESDIIECKMNYLLRDHT